MLMAGFGSTVLWKFVASDLAGWFVPAHRVRHNTELFAFLTADTLIRQN